MKKGNIVVVGDIILDKFTYGDVKRLNPESPAPLLDISREEYKLWGAANVAANIASLLEKSSLVGCIGKDISGNTFLQECHGAGIAFTPIYTEKSPTIVKQRFIETTYNHQILRVDYEQKISLSHEQKQTVLEVLQSLKPDFIVISDYLKWTIDEDLSSRIISFANENGSRILVDSKPKHMHFFAWVYLMKPNFKEFCEVIGKEIPNEDSAVEKEAIDFVKKHNMNLVITRSEKGATLVTREWHVSHLHTEAQLVFDVTGAGDTFIAAVVVALKQGMSLEDAVKRGNKASGMVVWKVGTSVVTMEEMSST